MRTFLIVLDSLGIGALPDAEHFGDVGANTLKRISESPYFKIPNLLKMGLGNIEGIDYLPKEQSPSAAYCRLSERSCGKDTTVGHWEIAGVISKKPLPTFPHGFPRELLEAFTRETGYEILCNQPYSGTQVIADYGEEHQLSGKLIVYTSADSVFQIAAHEEKVPLEELYTICRKARALLQGDWGVGRVIARPFIGEKGHFTRTANRRDFSLAPTGKTLLDALYEQGVPTIGVGKISDIFAGRGISASFPTHGNREGMETALKLAKEQESGLIFINLVDFDMLYGHRQDIDGYAKALSEFDSFLPKLLETLREEDRLLITADHGCDPGDESTDHTREYIPLLMSGMQGDFGTRESFADIGRTIAAWYGAELKEGERIC